MTSQQYVLTADSPSSIIGRYIMTLDSREIFYIDMQGQVMKVTSIIPNHSSNKDKDDYEIIDKLKQKGVKNVANPSTSDEKEYKRALSRINRRKNYRLTKENSSEPKIQVLMESIDSPLISQIQSCNFSKIQVQQPSKTNLDIIQIGSSPNEERSVLEWWSYFFETNYIKIVKGYLGWKKCVIPPILEPVNLHYLLPILSIKENKKTTYVSFEKNLEVMHKLARNLSNDDRIDKIIEI